MNEHVTETLVRAHLNEMLQDCHADGTRPSVLALAAKLGLSNTTFRRRFPEIVREVGAHRAPVHAAKRSPGPSPYDVLTARNAKLRRANRELRLQLRLAATQIQYLALRNSALQAEVEAQANVTQIASRFARG